MQIYQPGFIEIVLLGVTSWLLAAESMLLVTESIRLWKVIKVTRK